MRPSSRIFLCKFCIDLAYFQPGNSSGTSFIVVAASLGDADRMADVAESLVRVEAFCNLVRYVMKL